ncbi:MAG: VanR-ABDEGLN family response regulator transcription factor [Clostridiales bacterium]|nr:VanR-ABDEGLN family response regulator transcription factor [Clostridiales bacterium]
MKNTVLIVEDEKEIADLLETYLVNEGFEVHKAGCGKDALKFVELHEPDIALLDLMLPDVDGFAVCQKIRARHFFPIIMLTARADDMDKIMGLTIGADDYIAKPFNPLEVVARVKTQLRRYMRYNRPDVLEKTEGAEYDINGLVINKDRHECALYGKPVNLTPIEFSILWHLCENRGTVVSSEDLFEAVWGEKYMDSNNTVMAHVGRLREKLSEPARKPKFIKTVWGVGYKVE